MPELKEVFDMVTRQTEPEIDSWREQEQRQRRNARNRRVGAVAVTAAIMIALGLAGLLLPDDGRNRTAGEPIDPQDHPIGAQILALDGTIQTDLALPPDVWMADLSPDGGHVLFLTRSIDVGFCGQCVSGTDRLAIVPVGRSSGAYVYLEAKGVNVEHPVWSPNGRRIAFVGVDADGTRDIFVTDLPGGSWDGMISTPVRRLTHDAADEGFPAWSRDGTKVIYDSSGSEARDDSGFSSTQEIWSVSADGGVSRRLTRNDVPDSQPDVGPDGTVVFWRDGDVWTMDEAGGDQARLAAIPPGLGFSPRWSPDGTAIALLRYDSSERAQLPQELGRPMSLPLLDVVVVDVTSGRITLVGIRVASGVNPPSWTPDGGALFVNRYD
ncbi:MAG TPA: hypothetical protein VF108_05905 [Actinomycetota bacterium]